MSIYEIVAIVGSIDPKYHGITFISLEALFNKNGKNQIMNLIEYNNKYSMITSCNSLIPNVVRAAKFVMLTGKQDKATVLKSICDTIFKQGYVKRGYYEAVMGAGEYGELCYKSRSRITDADSSYVKRPVIVIAKAEETILWDDENKVSLICLLALDIDGKDGVRFLYNKFNNEKCIAKFGQAKTEEDMREALFNELC